MLWGARKPLEDVADLGTDFELEGREVEDLRVSLSLRLPTKVMFDDDRLSRIPGKCEVLGGALSWSNKTVVKVVESAMAWKEQTMK